MESVINERLILSLYDYTGNWAKPYVDAGYPVMLWDYKVEGDILDFDAIEEWTSGYQDFVYGILAAPPCTDFAVSGARWWQQKDKDKKRIENSCDLVRMVLLMVDFAKRGENFKFWALEQPVGRVETLVPELKQYRKMCFNPCDFGDPYTKKTILYGEFNHCLPYKNVLSLYGSMMHFIPPSEQRQEIRSATPKGFAKAFFLANQ